MGVNEVSERSREADNRQIESASDIVELITTISSQRASSLS